MSVHEKMGNVMLQGFKTAAITNKEGYQVGSIVIRYTKGTIGYNSETNVSLHTPFLTLQHDYSVKKNAYDRTSVYEILTKNMATCYDANDNQFVDHDKLDSHNNRNINAISWISQITYFVLRGQTYNILWVG